MSVLTPNEHEAEFLSGIAVTDEGSAMKAAARLRTRGAAAVIVTLGAGASAYRPIRTRGTCPRSPWTPVDTTAAGDVFNGALAVALAEKRPLGDAIRFAQAAAAISVTRPGAQPSAPTRAEIESFLD